MLLLFHFELENAGLAAQRNARGLCVVIGAYAAVGFIDAWIVSKRGVKEKVPIHAIGSAMLMGFAVWVLSTRPEFVP